MRRQKNTGYLLISCTEDLGYFNVRKRQWSFKTGGIISLPEGLTHSYRADANLSNYHFMREFKRATGRSPIQYCIHLKMQHVCQLLDSISHSVKQIADETGY